MRYLCMVLILSCLIVASCSPEAESKIIESALAEGDNVVVITITDNGISESASRINVKNFHSGASAEVIFLIKNESTGDISPGMNVKLDVNTSDYDVAKGYVTAPLEVMGWFDIPDMGTLVSGASMPYKITITMPDDAEDFADKWAFMTECAGNTGGRVQTAVGLWWLIDMR